MNKLLATIITICVSLTAAGALAADSGSTHTNATDTTSRQTIAESASESEAMSAVNMADQMKEDTTDHGGMAEDGTKNFEVK